VRQEVRNSLPWPSFRHGHPWKFNSGEIGAVATLGSTTGDSRVKYQPTSVVTVGFVVVVVVSIAWSFAEVCLHSLNLLGVHRPTTVAALLTSERRDVSSTLLGVRSSHMTC